MFPIKMGWHKYNLKMEIALLDRTWFSSPIYPLVFIWLKNLSPFGKAVINN